MNNKTLDQLITSALEECGLSPKEIAEVSPKIKEYAEFIDAKEDSTFWNFKQKIETLVKKFQEHGLTLEQYLQAALKQPPLFYQSPNTIYNNITQTVQKFQKQELTTKQYLQAALKRPQLFSQSPETIYNNITQITKKFQNIIKPHKEILPFLLKEPFYLKNALFCNQTSENTILSKDQSDFPTVYGLPICEE